MCCIGSEDKIANGYNIIIILCIMDNSPSPDEVKFNDHFVDQWIENSRRIRTCNEECHWIRNSIKRWHKFFRK